MCFEEQHRRRHAINNMRRRVAEAGVELYPVTAEQWSAIKKRFKDFKIKKQWFDFYNTVWKLQQPEAEYDVTKVIPGPVYYPYVDPVFSHPLEAKTMSDKNFTDLLFPEIRRPRTIVRYQDGLFLDETYKKIQKNEAYKLIGNAFDVVIKPSAASGGGNGIVFWNAKSDGIEILDKCFVKGRSFVVQELVKQHERMNALYSGSVNTIRMETFLWKNEVRLLSCLVRMGGNGSKVDNLSRGGMSCGINLETGQLSSKAYDFYHLNVTYDKHPGGRCEFKGLVIPNWEKCVDLVKSAAPRFARFAKLIAWDIAVAEDGEPVLIECNLMYSGCESVQYDNGPLFGDYTDEVLEYVIANRRRSYLNE